MGRIVTRAEALRRVKASSEALFVLSPEAWEDSSRGCRRSRVQRLRDAGFDLSEHVRFTRHWRVRCSMCEALVINGTPCHESGCGNAPRPSDDEDDS